MHEETQNKQKETSQLLGMRILIIEDDEYILRIYAKWLRNVGAEVLIANNGALGLKTLESETVDLVLLDLGMPGLNGYETLTKLRANSRISNIPVIILSNTTTTKNQELHENILKAGVTAILRKYETSLQELVEIIIKNI